MQLNKFLLCSVIGYFIAIQAYGQQKITPEIRKSANGKYTYTTIPNDPLGVRIYTLPNGLTVMTSVNKNEPRIYTMIATKAGSKHDPADNTGLAHYLEHMLFKGTDKFGTKDWEKEREQLSKIDALYEKYNKTTDDETRKFIYRQIDSVSLIASSYAIANEYDKMVSAIGATGTNAFTSVEQTVYINDIPSNQIENWLKIEAERFSNPALRLFHTELEAVYEEKNISLDNDNRKVYEALLSGLFTNHAYGTQSTIGTVEHLKNPSLVKIRDYFKQYYTPNNMAIILAGDLDPDAAVALIEKNFGYMIAREVPPYKFAPEPNRNSPTIKEVVGPDSESLLIGFRLPGANTASAVLLELIDYILSNGKAGLIDLNITKKQRALNAYSSAWINKDYSIHLLGAKPLEGQTLNDLKNLLLEQIEALKNGNFDEKLLNAIINNFKVEQIREAESSSGRANRMMRAFCVEKEWSKEVNAINQLSKITKEDIKNFVNEYYNSDYVVVYKRVGEDVNVRKIQKPEITPIEINREDISEFAAKIISTSPPELKPVFINFDKDIKKQYSKGVMINHIKNNDNALFSLYYVLDMGKMHNIKLPIAVDYMKYAGTTKYTAEQISQEFYNLACEFGFSTADDKTYVYISGLEENFEKAVALFEHLLSDIQPEQQVVDEMVERMLKQRADAKLNKSSIFWGAMRNYLTYGSENPYKYILSESDLRGINAVELCEIIKNATSYNHTVYYHGNREMKKLTKYLSKSHRVPKVFNITPSLKTFERRNTEGNKVYFVDYKMVQADMLWLSKQDDAYDIELSPVIGVFNEYFGGGMSSIVFQTIRESKALAYSTFSRYTPPSNPQDPYYISAYVGTQSDKLSDAYHAMNKLLKDMPISESKLATAISSIRAQIQTERTTGTAILFAYIEAQKFGRNKELREVIYNNLDHVTLETISTFHKSHHSISKFDKAIMGSKERISEDTLRSLGDLEVLTIDELFGY
jgi:predicted Zn-dependent peptidase